LRWLPSSRKTLLDLLGFHVVLVIFHALYKSLWYDEFALSFSSKEKRVFKRFMETLCLLRLACYYSLLYLHNDLKI
jgi:hypothetical protein